MSLPRGETFTIRGLGSKVAFCGRQSLVCSHQKAGLRGPDVLGAQTWVQLKTKRWGLLPADEFCWEGTACQEEVTAQRARHDPRGQVHLWVVGRQQDGEESLLALSPARPEDGGARRGRLMSTEQVSTPETWAGAAEPPALGCSGRKPRHSGNAYSGCRVVGRRR